MTPLQTLALTATLLAASNLFMTFAWYGHLKHLQSSPWYLAALVSYVEAEQVTVERERPPQVADGDADVVCR